MLCIVRCSQVTNTAIRHISQSNQLLVTLLYGLLEDRIVLKLCCYSEATTTSVRASKRIGGFWKQYSEYRGPNLDMKAFPLLSSLFTFEHSRIVLLPQSRWGVNWQCCGSRQVSCPANALWGTQTSAWNSAWFMFGIHKKEQSFSCEKWSLRDIERSKKILLGPSWQTLGALQLLRPLSLLQRQGVVAGPACRRSQRFQEGIALDSPGHFVGLFDWLFRYVTVHHSEVLDKLCFG